MKGFFKVFEDFAKKTAEEHWRYLGEEQKKEVLCGMGQVRWVARRKDVILRRLAEGILDGAKDCVSFPFAAGDYKKESA